jgi:hypothetical protein
VRGSHFGGGRRAWAKLLAVTPEQERAIRFYTALFCVDFMSEVGHAFNGPPAPVDEAYLGRLEAVLDAQLREL